MGIPGACGQITYTILDSDGVEVSEDFKLVRVQNFGGASDFYLEIDTRSW